MDTGLEDLFPVLVIVIFVAAALLITGWLLGWFDWIPNILSALAKKFVRF